MKRLSSNIINPIRIFVQIYLPTHINLDAYNMNKLTYILSFLLILISQNSIKAQNPLSKIVIIGAGISGLSAAKVLKEKGYDPIILEAQNKIGGRLKTNRSLGIAFDEGASWIHGPSNNPISSFISKAKLDTFLTKDELIKVYDVNGKEYSTEFLNNEEEKYNYVLDDLRGRKRKSVAQQIFKDYPEYQTNRLWTFMLSAYLEFDTGADIHKLSSKGFYDDESFNGEDVIITNGYDKITNYLAENLNIKLNTKVTNIDYSKDQIEISTNQETYIADKVIVTVPLGILKRNMIQFKPELPKRTQKAINGLEMGVVNKFLLVWDDVFWDKDVQYIGYTPKEKGKFNYFLNVNKYSDSKALMTFSFGDYAKETELMNDEEIIYQIMKHLKQIYGKDIPEPKKMLRTQWNKNPFTYGSYTSSKVGGKSKAIKVFEKSVKHKIYFAGEHTHYKYRGTVHGAYMSGIREAKSILQDLN